MCAWTLSTYDVKLGCPPNANYRIAKGSFRGTGRYGTFRFTGSIRLDTRELDDLAPFLGFFGDELGEVGGRTRKHRAAQVD